ncbi:hypothetical protein CLOM_g12178 [Closterium sp. NIES-68]|nr:hypothetical protein CLOM_g12178 [Closterium sp. NIES-68]GJP77303.1 hypothetical protein CLOP_g7719 [Closterium sp. NIES-67]
MVNLSPGQVNALIWCLLLAFTGWLLHWLFAYVTLWRRGNRFPGPKGHLFWGNTAELLGAGSVTDLIGRLHSDYGPVVRLWMSPTKLLISVRDPAQVRNVLMRALERPPAFSQIMARCFGAESTRFSSFMQPRARRSFLDYHCHTTLKFQVHEVTSTVVHMTSRHWTSVAGSGGEIDVGSVARDMVVGVLGGSLFGSGFPMSRIHARLQGLLEKVAAGAQKFSRFPVEPFWLPSYWQFSRVCEEFREVMRRLMAGECEDVTCGLPDGGVGNFSSGGQNMGNLECEGERAEQGPVAAAVGAAAAASAGFVSDVNIGRGTVDAAATAAAAGGISPRGRVRPQEAPHEGFLSAMLSERSRYGRPLYNEATALAEAASLMLHGHLSVPGLLERVLVALAAHPDIQDKVVQEIRAVAKGGSPTDEDLQELAYLNAVIYETARVMPCQPLVTRCALSGNIRLPVSPSPPKGGSSRGGASFHASGGGIGGMHGSGDDDGENARFLLVPPGTVLALPMHLLQMDPSYWGDDAAEFRPERFIRFRKQQDSPVQGGGAQRNEAGKEDREEKEGKEGKEETEGKEAKEGEQWREGLLPGRDYECVAPEQGAHFLMFGGGPRSCVGQRFSLKIVRAIVALLLHQFEVSLSLDMPHAFASQLHNLALHLSPSPRIRITMRKPVPSLDACHATAPAADDDLTASF